MAIQTENSGFLACTYAQYLQKVEDTEHYGPYWFYLVNHGVEEGVEPYTELYYGKNRLTDLVVIELDPSAVAEFNVNECDTVPNNKIIVQVQQTTNSGNNTTEITPIGLAVKYENQVLLLKDLIALKTDGNPSALKYLADDGAYHEVQGSGGGTTYSAGNGIAISGTTISAKIKSSDSYLTLNANGLSVDKNSLGVDEVKQLGAISTNANYPVLLSLSANTNLETGSVNKANALTYNPSSGTLTATKFAGDGSLLTNLPSGGGSGTTYSAGNGIDIDANNKILIKLRSTTPGLAFDGTDHSVYVDFQAVQNNIIIDDGIVGS